MPLEEEVELFEEMRPELLEHHQGQFALIVDGELIGTFDHRRDAYQKGIKEFGNVPMLIKKIDDEEDVDALPALTLGLIGADN